MTQEKLTRMKADTFRARLRLGLGFGGAVHVPESLKLHDSGITELCDTLCVDGDLNLTGCVNLERLPERLIVRGELILDGCTQIEHLPASVRELFGLSATGCAALKSIASVAECRGMVDLTISPDDDGVPIISTMAKVGSGLLEDRIVEIPQILPDVLMEAATGRRLGEVVSTGIVHLDARRIESITRYTGQQGGWLPESRTAIKLASDYVRLGDADAEQVGWVN